MDYLVKCYLEQFQTLPRNTLHDRRKRRACVEYISTLIEGYSRGQNCDRQQSVREAVIAIIRYHDENRADNGSVCMMGKYHNILYVAVKLCFDWQLKDTGTVMTLLEHIYSCEFSFERIFIGAIFGNKAPHYIAGWKSDFDNQEENLRAVVYYVDHATNGGLELEYENKNCLRFIDIPIESCGKASAMKISLQLGLPDKLHIFLRYGALIDNTETENSSVKHLLKRLMEFCHVYPYNLVACFQLVCRVIPRISGKKDDILEEFGDLVNDGIIPVTRCGVEVIELKHLCRCVIRKRLWQNYQLPNGISSLSLPETLKRYIDLMED